MKTTFKIFCAFLFAVSVSFAQDDFDNYAADDTTEEAVEDSYSAGSANSSDSEWAGFDYESAGLTQWEFQQAKENNLSRDKLTQLTELGIRPSEYLQEPWKRLGVSAEARLSSRAKGLEDSDIDRTYRNHSGEQNIAYLSALVPSLYQWKHDETVKAIWMDALWVVGVAGLTYFAVNSDEYDNTWVYWLIPVLGAHIWSFADAFFNTQWANNPDADRFSMGVGPSLNRGVAGVLQIRF